MEYIHACIEWFLANKEELAILLSAIGVLAEALGRIVPTKDGASVLEKIGRGVTWLLNFLKIPNKVKVERKDDTSAK